MLKPYTFNFSSDTQFQQNVIKQRPIWYTIYCSIKLFFHLKRKKTKIKEFCTYTKSVELSQHLYMQALNLATNVISDLFHWIFNKSTNKFCLKGSHVSNISKTAIRSLYILTWCQCRTRTSRKLHEANVYENKNGGMQL